ncbi:MAG: hypothetical protein K2I56_05240 [Muribaculaceae bacterium]|nr:hypothetical protein [Muribaculaceae bacterium]
MNKKFFALAIAAMSVMAFNTNAQTTSISDKCEKTKTECTGKKCARSQNVYSVSETRPARISAFDKMNLSADQKAKVEQLNQKRREAVKAQAQARRADKQRGDSAARAGRQEAQRQYLSELKSIIGPENYVVFLEDFYVNGQGMREVKAGHVQHMAKKHDKAKKGERRQRPSKADVNSQRMEDNR